MSRQGLANPEFHQAVSGPEITRLGCEPTASRYCLFQVAAENGGPKEPRVSGDSCEKNELQHCVRMPLQVHSARERDVVHAQSKQALNMSAICASISWGAGYWKQIFGTCMKPRRKPSGGYAGKWRLHFLAPPSPKHGGSADNKDPKRDPNIDNHPYPTE